MQRSSFSDQPCSVARTLDIIGDRWTPLVLRDIAIGISRFDAIQRDLGLSRKVLTQRLEAPRRARRRGPGRVPGATRRATTTGSPRRATTSRWCCSRCSSSATSGPSAAQPPIQWRHLSCGQISAPVACCDHCGEQVRPGEAIPLRGPSFDDEERAGRGRRRWTRSRPCSAERSPVILWGDLASNPLFLGRTCRSGS